jgi:hypothetical protein
VIRDHPKLLVFPIITGVLTTLIAFFFLVPVVAVLLAPNWFAGSRVAEFANSIGFLRYQHGASFNFQIQPLGTALLAGMYLLNMFLASMAGVAFNHEIMEALSGRPVSIRQGVEAACVRWKPVLLWSLLAGVVGLIIRAIEERLPFVGRLVAGFIGLAWSVAAIFAIPILAREPAVSNPVAILTQSAKTIKKTWGEMLAGYVGMRGTNLLIVWLSLLFWVGTGTVAFLSSNPWLLLFAGVPWLALVVAYGYLASIASRVYLCALYLYAAEGFVPGAYDANMMAMGWKMKKSAN